MSPEYCRVFVSAALALGLSAACTARDEPQPSATGGNDSLRVDTPVCLRGEPFVTDGGLPVPQAAGPADARGIRALRWQRHDSCERFVIDLEGASGADAGSAGELHAEVLRDLGIVRITLPDIAEVSTTATDARFEGPLAFAAFTVSAPDRRGFWVDLHLADAAEAHVTTLASPARVIVDLRPGGPPLPPPPATHQRVVVLQPRAGSATWPLAISGYARTFEANVVARIERDGTDIFEDFTTSTGWLEAWGYFAFNIPDGPAAPVRLHVGEYSARDGTWEGAVIPLDMR